MKTIVLSLFIAAATFTAASVVMVNQRNMRPASVLDVESGLLAGTPPPICPPVCPPPCPPSCVPHPHAAPVKKGKQIRKMPMKG